MSDFQDVNWRLLRSCYGNAAEIPQWLRQLASSDAAARQAAFEELTDQIYHQGTAYEATPHVIPSLIDLLANPRAQDKQDILDLLWILQLIPSTAERDGSPRLASAAEHDFADEIARSALYAEQTRREIRKGIPVYLSLLNDENPKVRIEAARLLSELRQDLQDILPVLLQHARTEGDAKVKAALIWSIGILMSNELSLSPGDTAEIVAFLDELVGRSEDMLVKFSASASLLKVTGNGASQEAVDFVIDAATRPETELSLPWLEGVLWTACDALSELQGEKRISAFEKVLGKCDRVEDMHHVVIMLLNRVFRGKDARRQDLGIGYNRAANGADEWIYTTNYKVTPVRKLSQEQEAAVRIVLKDEKFWAIRNNLLEAYGLPGTRDDLQKFLTTVSVK